MSLNAKQLLFVDALLQGKTPTVAARELGINESLGRRWWRDPKVQAEFDARRLEHRNLALAYLQVKQLAGACELFTLATTSENERVRRAAATDLVRYGFKATEVGDLIGELKALVERLSGVDPGIAGGSTKAGGGGDTPP